MEKPIDDGAIIVFEGKIAEVGRYRDLSPSYVGQKSDLGEVALFPGLVNAHCHFDYTNMAGALPPPKSFPDWIKGILALKAQWSYSEYAASWVEGATQSLRNGITTVGDIESVPELIEEAWAATPLRMISFVELTGVKSQHTPKQVLKQGLEVLEGMPDYDHKSGGLSPHAPYSTTAHLLSLVAKESEERNLRVAMHVAESEAEFNMFMHASGPMFDWLKGQRDMRDCGECSPVTHLDNHNLLSNRLLAVHVNYLAPGDAFRLGKARAHVVHCPRSHDYFEHDRFPYDELKSSGINIALGTDSLASTRMRGKEKPELNLFDELAQFSKTHSGVRPLDRVELVTVNAARALGMEGKVGQISPEAFADVITLQYDGRSSELYEWMCHERPTVSSLMLDGHWSHEPVDG